MSATASIPSSSPIRLYLGSRDYRPDGYLTVDTDPTHQPDFLCDVRDLQAFADNSVDEICASHILEHIPWPSAFQAIAEWTRVLKPGGILRIAVPDAKLLASLIIENRNPWHAVGLLFGVGRIENPLEAHAYCYSNDMLSAILRVLGFTDLQGWSHAIPDASSGWMPLDGGKVGISLNIQGTKTRAAIVDPARLTDALMNDRMAAFDHVVAGCIDKDSDALDPITFQFINHQLTEANQRAKYLENRVSELERENAKLSEPRPEGPAIPVAELQAMAQWAVNNLGPLTEYWSGRIGLVELGRRLTRGRD